MLNFNQLSNSFWFVLKRVVYENVHYFITKHFKTRTPDLSHAAKRVVCSELLCLSSVPQKLANHLAQHVVYDFAVLVLRTEQNDFGVLTDSH